MKMVNVFLKLMMVLLTAVIFSSCCTTSLWRSTDPHECIEVSFDEMTEEALIEDGFTYRKDNAKQFFYIEKDSKQKLGNYTWRVVGMPVTIAADTFLIGFTAIAFGMSETPAENVNRDNSLAAWGYH